MWDESPTLSVSALSRQFPFLLIVRYISLSAAHGGTPMTLPTVPSVC
jgi:hypothetical protein